MEIPQKTKNRTIIHSSNSTPGYISKENENSNLKRYMHPNSSIIYKAKIQKQLWYSSTDEWIKKMWCIYTVEYYSSIKKE